MSSLFQRLLELGEERPALPGSETTLEACAAATKEELAQRLLQMSSQLEEQKSRYSHLLEDATKLRLEYDTYRRTAEREKQQKAEQRTEEKCVLEDLRRAGASGKPNEVYVKEAQAQVTDLQMKLQKALEEVDLAQMRQREAELARVEVENVKKEEFQRLCLKFEEFRTTMQQQNEQLLEKLAEPHDSAVAGKSSEITSFFNTAGDEVADQVGCDMMQDEATAAGTADGDVTELQAQLAAAAQREKQLYAKLVSEQEHFQRQLADNKWEIVEAEKKILELKMDIDKWRSRSAQLENVLQVKCGEHAEKENKLQHASRKTEDLVLQLQSELQEVRQSMEHKCQEFNQALICERESSIKHSAKADEADSVAKMASEAMHEQRAHYEHLLREHDMLLQEQRGACRTLEAALQAEQEERSREAKHTEELRLELNEARHMINELNLMQAQSQHLIVQLEEEEVLREEERQRLQQMLREEEEAHHSTRQLMAELKAHRCEMVLVDSTNAASVNDAVDRFPVLERECNVAKAKVKDQQMELQAKENTIRQLQLQQDDLIAQTAKFACYREEYAAKVSKLEGRIRELEAGKTVLPVRRLQDGNSFNSEVLGMIAPEGAPNSGSVASLELLYSSPSERLRHQFVSDAVMSARKMRIAASLRFRKLLLLSLVCILVVMFVTSYLSTASNTDAAWEAAVLHALRREGAEHHGELKQRCRALLLGLRNNTLR